MKIELFAMSSSCSTHKKDTLNVIVNDKRYFCIYKIMSSVTERSSINVIVTYC